MKANPVSSPNWVLVRPRSGTMKLAKLARSWRSTKFITLSSVSRHRNAYSRADMVLPSSFIEPPRRIRGESSRGRVILAREVDDERPDVRRDGGAPALRDELLQ